MAKKGQKVGYIIQINYRIKRSFSPRNVHRINSKTLVISYNSSVNYAYASTVVLRDFILSCESPFWSRKIASQKSLRVCYISSAMLKNVYNILFSLILVNCFPSLGRSMAHSPRAAFVGHHKDSEISL